MGRHPLLHFYLCGRELSQSLIVQFISLPPRHKNTSKTRFRFLCAKSVFPLQVDCGYVYPPISFFYTTLRLQNSLSYSFLGVIFLCIRLVLHMHRVA